MKISTLTNIATVLSALFGIVTLCLLVLVLRSVETERYYESRQVEFIALGDQLRDASDLLTREARRYAIFGNKRHYDAFWREVNETKTRDKVVKRLKELNVPDVELALIETAKTNSDALIAIEEAAMDAVAKGDLKAAQRLMFNDAYDRSKRLIMQPLKAFQDAMNNRAAREAKQAKERATWVLWATSAVVATFLLLVFLMLYFVLKKRVIHPLTQVTGTINSIISGKKGVTVPHNSQYNEIAILAEAAKVLKKSVTDNNNLSEALSLRQEDLEKQINQRTKELQDTASHLQTVMDAVVDGLMTINDKGLIQTFNPSATRIFGYTADEVIGRNVKMLMPEPYHGEHDGYLHNYLTTGNKKIIGIGREVEAQRKDGTVFPMELGVSELQAGNERVFVGTIRDISERKEAEEIIENTVEDLRLMNEELEKFAYIASHDLKSPLRAIDNLTQWMQEDLEDSLDDENRDRMVMLRGRVSRMEKLLDDLLEYSRAGHVLENSEMIKVDHLIGEVSGLLNVPKGFVITTEEGVKDITIPRMPLTQVFHNLISNALKHHDKGKGKITVSGKDIGKFYEFSVSDDGPGIPEQFQEKVFEMFRTLKPRDQVEGSGMGLALVKKIIYNVGGHIRLESEEGKGAFFTFTWPKEAKLRSDTTLRKKNKT